MTKLLTGSIVIAASIALSGCGINLNQPTPEVTYHLLDSQQKTMNHRLPDTRVALSKVKLADYLLLPNLVMRKEGNQLDVASYHNWAEPLDKAIKRILISNLNSINQRIGVVNKCKDCEQIEVAIDHFYPNETGDVVLAGHFVVKAGDAESVEYFSFTQPQLEAGYSQSVVVMNTLLKQLSNKINSVISTN